MEIRFAIIHCICILVYVYDMWGGLERKEQEELTKEVESREEEGTHLIETERALAGVRKETSPKQEAVWRRDTREQSVRHVCMKGSG